MEAQTIEQQTVEETKGHQFLFSRFKRFGRVRITVIETTLNISEDLLTIDESKTTLLFTKKILLLKTKKIGDIKSISVKHSMDINNVIFAIIFAVIGFVQPPAFLVTALLLWMGYAKKMRIEFDDETIVIPAKDAKQFNELIGMLKEKNQNIA